MLVYDKKGIAHDKESIDVRECVEILGWTTDKVKRPRKSRKKKTEIVIHNPIIKENE